MEKKLIEFLKTKNVEIVFKNIDRLPEMQYAMERTKGFGASDAAVLLQVSPWKSLQDLLREKELGEIDPTISAKPVVRKGKDLEPLLIKKASEYFKTPILKPKNMYGKASGLRTNFDGILIENDIWIPNEIKLCTRHGRKYYDFTKALEQPNYSEMKINPTLNYKSASVIAVEESNYYGIPVYYYAQLQQQCLFLDAPYGYLSVMDDENWTMYYFKVLHNRELTEYLEKIAQVYYLQLQIRKGTLKPTYEEI